MNHKFLKRQDKPGPYQWLTPVILATQETEIRRVMIRSQPRANSLQDPISENKTLHKQRLAEWLKM
jgi:hypothetical protein